MIPRLVILTIVAFLTTACTSNPKCEDRFKDGDVVEITAGNYRGYVGYCQHTTPSYYNEKGLRLVVLKLNPLGDPIFDAAHVSFCDLTPSAKWKPKYRLPILYQEDL